MFPLPYELHSRNGEKVFRIIDTPGLNSTKGETNDEKESKKQDQENITYILNLIGRLKIDAFIILLKPQERKLDSAFTNSFKTIFKQLDSSAKNNVIFGLTHAENGNWKDLSTLNTLKKFFTSNNIDLDIDKKRNVFYFDNSPFRYLTIRTVNPGDDAEDQDKMVEYWNRSVESCHKMLTYIKGLEGYEAKSLEAINDCRAMIEQMTKAMVRISQVTEENLNELTNELKNYESANSTKVVQIREKVLTFKRLDQAITVCTNPCCFKRMKMFENEKIVYQDVYKPFCCEGCTLSWVAHSGWYYGRWFCSMMDKYGNCKVCKHHMSEHLNIKEELKEATEEIKMKLSDIKERKNALKMEFGAIIHNLVIFSRFLKHNTLFSDQEFVESCIAKEMDVESKDLGREEAEQQSIMEKIEEYADKDLMKEGKFIDEQENIIAETRQGLSLLQDIKNTREAIADKALDVSGAYKDVEISDLVKQLKTLNNRLRPILQEKNLTKGEYFLSLTQRKNEAETKLEELRRNPEAELEESKRFCREKKKTIQALKNMTNKYKESLEKNATPPEDLTPEKIEEGIRKLSALPFYGNTFKEIYDNIKETKRMGLDKIAEKIFKIGIDILKRIPKRFRPKLAREN
ncbi:probable DNA double-strand break repair Rad50 ATPase [Clytia hemisphaerica]|uniref:DUF8206 domain-containing protein n=1 Tax=Clytia hemisphaerica TaxID=252671 RepID=A0A7M5WX49_9CNID